MFRFREGKIFVRPMKNEFEGPYKSIKAVEGLGTI